MTLGTHAVVGAFVGAAAAHNLPLAAAAAFASHFLMDSIPHWDYAILSIQKDPANPLNDDMGSNRILFYKDLIRTGFDFGLGLLIAFLLFKSTGQTVLVGALLGGVCAALPDALQFLYWKVRKEPLISLQRFHLFMHADHDFNNEPIIGFLMQAAIVVLVAVLSALFFI